MLIKPTLSGLIKKDVLMIKWGLKKFGFLLVLALVTPTLFAGEPPPGFLWYNLPKKPKPIKKQDIKKSKGIPFNSLSYTQRDAVLRFYTMEALHKAHHTNSMKDMKTFLALQDYWLKESSKFQHLFQKTLLYYPQYDYTVTHPTSAVGTKLVDSRRKTARKEAIENLAKTRGLLLFYRGANQEDLKQLPIVSDFCKRFNLPLVLISVDGQASQEFGGSRLDKGQADALGVHFFPAMLLINPKTKKTLPVAYGLTTQDVLEQHLYFAATQFKGEPNNV